MSIDKIITTPSPLTTSDKVNETIDEINILSNKTEQLETRLGDLKVQYLTVDEFNVAPAKKYNLMMVTPDNMLWYDYSDFILHRFNLALEGSYKTEAERLALGDPIKIGWHYVEETKTLYFRDKIQMEELSMIFTVYHSDIEKLNKYISDKCWKLETPESLQNRITLILSRQGYIV